MIARTAPIITARMITATIPVSAINSNIVILPIPARDVGIHRLAAFAVE
jgi:hypothetical protein